MSIQNMHYDFKKKLNKLDSQKYKNLKIQEIDWALNEAYGIFVKTTAQPRIANQLGFESNSRTINDIRVLVNESKPADAIVFDERSYRVELPEDYWFLVSSFALGNKGNCQDRLETNEVQHDDRHEESPYNQSSFEWRETNFRFYSGGLRFFTDETFTINKVYLDYIRTLKYMHFASGVQGGTYKLPDGTILTGTQDCELPKELHAEIVDIAVLIATGELQMPDYQVKMAKVNNNN